MRYLNILSVSSPNITDLVNKLMEQHKGKVKTERRKMSVKEARPLMQEQGGGSFTSLLTSSLLLLYSPPVISFSPISFYSSTPRTFSLSQYDVNLSF